MLFGVVVGCGWWLLLVGVVCLWLSVIVVVALRFKVLLVAAVIDC